MKRTYNEFIDNGLFVVSHHLKKDIQDITIDDLKETTDYFANLAIKILDNEGFRNIVYTGYFSSQYEMSYRYMNKYYKTFNERKNNVHGQYNNLLNSISNDKYCICCGEKQVNINLEIGRNLMPDIVAGKFYNSANNIQIVDICPVCCYLSLLSIFNVIPIITKKGTIPSCILYLSDSDNVMRKITEKNQNLILTQSILNSMEIPKRQSLVNICNDYRIPEFLLKNVSFITQLNFVNNKNGSSVEKDIINNKKLLFINKLSSSNNIEHFFKFYLYHALIDDKSMIKSLINQEKKYLEEGDIENMCDKIEEYEIPSRINILMNKTFDMLMSANDEVSLRKDIKLCDSIAKFEQFLLKNYEKSNINEDLTEGEIYELTNYKYWNKYKYLLEWKLIREIKKNKGGNYHE